MDLKDAITMQMLCNACLCVGRTLYQVTDEKIKRYYLCALNEIPLCNIPTMLKVCLDCKALLKKSCDFREQVKDSYRILMAYKSETLTEFLLTDVSRPPRLKIVNNEYIDINPEGFDIAKENFKQNLSTNIGFQENEGSQATEVFHIEGPSHDCLMKLSASRFDVVQGYRQTQEVFVKEELKIEDYDSDRDAEFNFPLVGMKQIDTLADVTDSQTDICIRDKSTRNIPLMGKAKKKELRSSKKIKKKKKIKKTEDYHHNRESNLEARGRGLVATKQKRAEEITLSPLASFKPSKKDAVEITRIVTIQMSYEEMMEERRQELNRDSYISAEFKCETCIVGFNYNKSFKKHLLSRHSQSIGKYTCPICKTVLSTVDSFSTHYKRHMRRYECSICHKRAADLKSMQQHLYSTHDISLKQYTCGECGNISNSVDSHRYHTDTHKSRLQCAECDKTFRHRGGLLNHRLTVHEARNKFPCTYCDKVFRWKNSLQRHLHVHDHKNQCGVKSVAHCALCGVSFASIGSYKRHMANSLQHVTKEHFRFICDHCNGRFADKTKLRDHIEEKHLHRTYQCNICLKTFMNRVNLDQHTRNVHKGRPNNKMCHHCGKGFPTKAQLESHIRTHTGERPYICELCPTTFSQPSNLYKHNRQVHLNMKSKRYPAVKKRKDDGQLQLSQEHAPVARIEYPGDMEFAI